VGLPRERRIRQASDFRKAVRDGVRIDGQCFVAFFRSEAHVKTTRLGLSVGRRVGNAVHRNRVKRLLREAFRMVVPADEQMDVVLVAKTDAPRRSLVDLSQELRRRVERARSRRRSHSVC
jgi:ribonuclease P protein component